MLDAEIIEQLFVAAEKSFFQLKVDLPSQQITNAELNFKSSLKLQRISRTT